ncbi:MARVEL domain-containing protein [Histoplasma ohiense]|nr:MARVEL domain-containing protein [Histoplasma ohiense (nom. inval.)]
MITATQTVIVVLSSRKPKDFYDQTQCSCLIGAAGSLWTSMIRTSRCANISHSPPNEPIHPTNFKKHSIILSSTFFLLFL